MMTIKQRLIEWLAGDQIKLLKARNEKLVNQAEALVSEAVPNLQYKDGKLTEDGEAAVAIKALTYVPLAASVGSLELVYQQYSTEGRTEEALAAVRAQVGILARAAQSFISDKAAAGADQYFGSEYQRMVAELQGLRGFLRDHFSGDLLDGESLNRPLLETAKVVMLRGRS